jgi:transcription-repair coupling factor (superfamily II helicase)
MEPSHASTAELHDALARELRVASVSPLDWRLLGLRRGAVPYLLARLLEGIDRPVLVVTAHAREADELVAGLETVLGERATRGFLGRRIHSFPARETPPLEMVSAPVEVEAGRIAALYQLQQMRAPILDASIDALALRTLPAAALKEASLYLVVGDDVDLEELTAKLLALGYRRTGLVEEPGEVAVRGGIVDFWPPGSDYPCRVELAGDTIESIRYFDPGDQRSIGEADETAVLPAGAFPVSRLADPAVRRAVLERCNDLMLAAGERRQIDAQLADPTEFPGYELLMPYVYTEPASFADYLPDNAVIAIIDPPNVETAIDETFEQLRDARAAAEEAGTFYPAPERLFCSEAELRALLARAPRVELDLTETIGRSDGDGAARKRMLLHMQGNEGVSAARARVRTARGESRFHPMVEELSRAREGHRLVVLASDPTQLERLAHLLALNEVHGVERAETLAAALAGSPERMWLVQGHLEEGFRFPADNLVVITDEEIFGERRRPARRHKISRARALSALTELKPGDYMVHVDHGIGIYRGLKHIVAGGTEGDFIHLEYAGGDRLYLPVDRINLVEKYTGAGGTPPLARLGSQAWQRTKRKAKESILKLAHELLELEAFRAHHTRDAFARPDADYEEFEAHFPFEETADQKKAIAEVVRDLTREKPMDRVVCGDVGYGKTEVALRAAYLSAVVGRQVAVLVPTTVLARQHFDTFRERFDSYPMKVEMLSRFHTAAENKRIVEGLRAGTVDVVVGTHRLLQRDVAFARLGLVIVDEEHRFGVKAKERMKQLRREVDVLTLTATPIPRTLQLALTGVRDLSLIETPPVDRLAIRTYVARYDEGLIKQSIERELARGGQVFFVHNRVNSIAGITERVRELAPKARIAVAHGQMKEGELEKVMLGFLAHESDVLVCTSIIESGLDIPNANTVLINRADAFGLAQLYQIRGRVGRSHRRAYAYLLVPGEAAITEEARQRLAVLQQLDDLGSGFRLAAHDMEIRGAGNLLGKEQSGHVAAVGFELFMQMMEEAAAELRGTDAGPRIEPEIELGAEAFIPEGYIDDVGERLLLYKRMANAPDRGALDAIVDELADRFGPLPRPVQDFVRVMALRPALKALAVESLTAAEGTAALRFHEDSPVDRNELVKLATEKPERFRLRPAGVFTMSVTARGWHEMVDEIERFLDQLVARSQRRSGQNTRGEATHASIR